MHDYNDIDILLYKKITGQPLQDSERAELETWANTSEKNRQYYEKMGDLDQFGKEIRKRYPADLPDRQEQIKQSVLRATGLIPKTGKRIIMRTTIAAIVVGLISLAGWWFLSNDNQELQTAIQYNTTAPIVQVSYLPDNTILTLSDNTTINLSKSEDGFIATAGNYEVVKKGNRLLYKAIVAKKTGVAFSNAISVPRGQQYELVFADGSLTKINFMSAIRYTVSENGTVSIAHMNGEVSFYGDHRHREPFLVSVYDSGFNTEKASIKALGTYFNVRAYDNEPEIKTSLLEGLVSVHRNNESILLTANRQAIISGPGKIITDTISDPEAVTGWQRGVYKFLDSTTIETILNQLERLYSFKRTDTTKLKTTISKFIIFKEDGLKKILDNLVTMRKIDYDYDEKRNSYKITPPR